MDHSLIVSLILVFSGILGGIINFIYDDGKKLSLIEFVRSVLLGVGASLLVPLFLKMISSSLIEETAKDSNSYFVLMGFCLTAAISSRSFIGNISKKLLNEIKERTYANEHNIETVQTQVQPIVDKASEPEDADDREVKAEIQDDVINQITQLDFKLLNAFDNSEYTLRSVRGLMKQIGHPLNRYDEIRMRLKALEKLTLVGEATNIATNSPNPRWFLTTSGRSFIRNNSIDLENLIADKN